MPLRYGLVSNHLTDEPNDCMAVVQDNETFSQEQIVERMLNRGTSVTKADALSVLEEYHRAVVDIIKEGNNVNTDLFSIYPSISGVFTNESDGFDASRHSVKLNLNAGSRMKEEIRNIELKKVSTFEPIPVLQVFTDLKNNTVNESFTPGQIASIKGSLLKFDEADPQQGIFFLATDGSETRVTQLVKNKPSELLFFIPDSLTSGTFQVEVRAIFRNYKTLRKGRLLIDLTVAN